MEELAERAANGYYTDTDKGSMQEQFEELANDINDIVDSIEYNGNKLFTDKGQTITRVVTRAVGKERTIHLFARDLSFDAESVDLTKDAKAALRTVNKTLKQAVEYSDYLRSQHKLLQDAMTVIENEMAGAARIDSCDLETEITQQFVACLSAKISEDKDTFSHVQSNITADKALHLLRDRAGRW
jgi:flagellin-like hook-associated protein FlgL